MAKRDYYEVLGVDKDAGEDEIKSTYRKLALTFHPDRNPGDAQAEANFKEASEAYEVLSDADKRANYDRFGHAGTEGNFGSGGFQWSDFTHAGDVEDIFGDFFGSIFSGGGRRQRGSSGPPRGRDLKIALKLNLEEVVAGTEKKINLQRHRACGTCGGDGAAPGTDSLTCDTCGGVGQVQQISRSFFGQSVAVTPCPKCQGEGKIIADPCRTCSGEGRVREKSTITVRIPAGVSTGNYIPLRGQGDVGLRGGPEGDCLVFIEEIEHDHFEREGNDIIFRLPISIGQAALGDEVQVETLHGDVQMKIPEGTQSGRIFRLRGKGVPDVESRGIGDQLVKVVVWTPTRLSAEERRVFEELNRLQRERVSNEGRSFFDKMRETLRDG
ncbi:MAG: molecular chaperone DnaJ [Candidatus Latescibacterota bacterium]|nr:molecular chaperone DnaJ [Candidatus Latescibacterota bacterium]